MSGGAGGRLSTSPKSPLFKVSSRPATNASQMQSAPQTTTTKIRSSYGYLNSLKNLEMFQKSGRNAVKEGLPKKNSAGPQLMRAVNRPIVSANKPHMASLKARDGAKTNLGYHAKQSSQKRMFHATHH